MRGSFLGSDSYISCICGNAETLFPLPMQCSNLGLGDPAADGFPMVLVAQLPADPGNIFRGLLAGSLSLSGAANLWLV